MLFPTFFNNLEGGGLGTHINCYLCDGLFVRSINCDINKWIDADNMKWVMVAPGFITIGRDNYVAFMTNSEYHGGMGGVSKYWIIKTVLKK